MIKIALTLLTAGAGLHAWGGEPVYDPLQGSGKVERKALSADFFKSSAAPLLDFSAFAVPVNAANPDQQFSGTLTLANVGDTGEFSEVNTRFQGAYKNPRHLPRFSYQFLQLGTHIFPVRRGLQITGHPDYEYILEPGRVWQEEGDSGFSRAAIPFSLQEKGANCTHQGVMSFLFMSDGRMSKVDYQIAGETCQYFQFNMWGLAEATYTPEKIPGSAALVQAYREEVASRMPTKPISQLAQAYPAAGVIVENIAAEQTPAHTTLFGVAIDGINYTSRCHTRYGDYPYCDVLDLPSYSLAKSIAGAVGLMRLEQKFPGTKDLRMGNLVPACTGKQWADVSLQNTLDMATGNFTSAGYEVDEASDAMEKGFFLNDSNRGKTRFACSYARQAQPGTAWVYHTPDTFLLGAAMNAVLSDKSAHVADFYADMLVEELYKPLHMSPTTYTTVRTFDAEAAPFTGYGLTLHRDDLVKIGEFLNTQHGTIDGRAMLDDTLLREALQKTSQHGLVAGAASSRYLHGFWAWDAGNNEHGPALCPHPLWIPYMSGFGGIGLVLLPNDMVYYFFSDKHEYGFKSALIELNRIRPFCPGEQHGASVSGNDTTSANFHQ